MKNNPLIKLASFGQSIWLDFTRRGLVTSGKLKQLIDEDGLRGVTSNPSIFEKAFASGDDYDEAISTLASRHMDIPQLYETIAVQDIQQACDVFRPTFDRLGGRDGFVSMEVSPRLAHDTEGTIAEAHRLWSEVNRPNLMIKVPATKEGLPAIQQLTYEGLNINITLLFGLPRYREVAQAFIAGLERRADEHKPLDHIQSVASFFLSRIDVLVDPMIEKVMQAHGREADLAASVHGQVAIASAKVAYQIYQELFVGPTPSTAPSAPPFMRLVTRGAHPQRLLWASTSTKNPAYSDVKYVEPLIGPATINTLPMETLEAYRDHGNPAPRLAEDTEPARRCLQALPALGIDLDRVTQQLEDEGVGKFDAALDQLLQTLEKKRSAATTK